MTTTVFPATRAQVRVDSEGKAITIDTIYDAANNGELFRVNAVFTLGLAATKLALFRTGAKQANMYGEVGSTLAGTFNFYEAPTVTTVGTPVSILNKNRTTANTPLSLAYDSPTVSANGTLLDPFLLGTTKKAGGGARSEGWILAANTDYLMEITSAAAANDFVVKLDWFEV